MQPQAYYLKYLKLTVRTVHIPVFNSISAHGTYAMNYQNGRLLSKKKLRLKIGIEIILIKFRL